MHQTPSVKTNSIGCREASPLALSREGLTIAGSILFCPRTGTCLRARQRPSSLVLFSAPASSFLAAVTPRSTAPASSQQGQQPTTVPPSKQFTMSEHDHETFETTDAGASHTFPQQAGTIRKNGFIVIKGRPCKVVDVSTSKTGKHGHAKCNFVGVDIFTGKKYEDMTPSSHNMDVPNISRTEYTLLDVNEEGFVSLMAENGDTREDLTLPKGTEDAEKLAEQIKEQFAAGQELIVSVLKSMGDEMINSIKVVQN